MAAARGGAGRLSPGSPFGGVASSPCPKSALRLLRKQQPRRGRQVAVLPPGLCPPRGLDVPQCRGEGTAGSVCAHPPPWGFGSCGKRALGGFGSPCLGKGCSRGEMK